MNDLPGKPYHSLTSPPLPPLTKGGRQSPFGRLLKLAFHVCLVTAMVLSAGFAPADELVIVPLRSATRDKVARLRAIGLAAGTQRNWGPEQAAGPPDVPAAGTNPLAWTSLTADGQKEWLLCEFEAPIEARAVIVHESAFPGGLVQVSAFNVDGDEIIAWEGDDPTPVDKPRGVSVIPVKLAFPVGRIRVTIDSPAVAGWNEIDAVGIEDADGKISWAKHVEASSTYAMPANVGMAKGLPAYAAVQAVGPPDSQGPGDHSTAWCPAAAGGQADWLECRFKTAQNPSEIVVYENLSPGGITRIGVFDDDDHEVAAWEGTDPTPRGEPWGVSVFPVNVTFAFRKLRLYLNSPAGSGYHEIDAVGLRDDGQSQWAAEAEASSTWGDPQMMAMMNSRGMPAQSNSETGLRELQQEVKALKEQIDQLRKQLQELKDSRKE